jgi:hypothetical protein
MGAIVSVHLLADLGDAFRAFGIGQNSIEVGATAVSELQCWLPFHSRPIRPRVRTGECSQNIVSLRRPPRKRVVLTSANLHEQPTCAARL